MKKWMIFIGLVLCVAGVWMRYDYMQKSTLRFVAGMGNGINIGNTLDATDVRQYIENPTPADYETFWNSPRLDEDGFRYLKELGFDTVRLPVTWEEHLEEEMLISEEWMSHVKNVVDMALKQDLYVIINIHHDKWADLQLEKKDEILKNYAKVWQQIAQTFADYEEHLLFEAINEPRLRDAKIEWTAGDEAHQEMVNQLNETFVNVVRKEGEQNANRYLLISTYGNDESEEAIEALRLPKDKKIIVSVHMYHPYFFCQKDDGDTAWDGNTKELEKTFQTLYQRCIKKYVPVILTEFGCKDKDNLEERVRWASAYKALSIKYGIPCYWWDAGDYRIIDRKEKRCYFPEIVRVLLEGKE